MPSTPAPARAALSLLVLGLAACSYSFQAGSHSSTEAGKPATADADGTSRKPTSKPITKTDPAEAKPAETEPTEPERTDPTRTKPEPAAEDEDPARQPGTEEPPPVVEPRLTAVCRVEDPTLEALCHRALDPIAADDVDAFIGQLGEGVVVTRPGYRKGTQRLQGLQAVRDAATTAGGLRAFLHLRTTDRVVGTVANDCRMCRRSFVAFDANTRSGTVTVTMDMTQPPAIRSVQVDSQMRRRNLEPARRPAPKPPATIVVPPAEDEPSTEPVEPKREPDPTLEPKPQLVPKPAPTRPTRKKKVEP
jgi:hypothetical protein